jgi:hypothetical protein
MLMMRMSARGGAQGAKHERWRSLRERPTPFRVCYAVEQWKRQNK